MRHLLRNIALGAVATACALAAGCGGSGSSSPATTTTGGAQGPKSITLDGYKIPTDGPLRLAAFMPGLNNAYVQAYVNELKAAVAKVPGAELTVFDGRFDPTVQINQVQNAIQSGRFNAALAAPTDGNLTCNAFTKQAPQAGILVGDVNLALCGRTDREGADLRAPGTLNFIGGTQTPGYWYDYLSWIAERNPGPQKVLALTDPPAPFPLTRNFETALARVEREHPDFKVVGSAATDLTVPGSNQRMAQLIQAHGDATLLVTMFSTETQGAVQALKAAGKLGKLKIYDKGATAWAVGALKDGTIEATAPELPASAADAFVQSIVDARAGKRVPPFVKDDGGPVPAGAPVSGFYVFTRATIGDFVPQAA